MKKFVLTLLILLLASPVFAIKSMTFTSDSSGNYTGALFPKSQADCSTETTNGQICTDSDTSPYITYKGDGTSAIAIKPITDTDNDSYPDKAEDLVITSQATDDILKFDGANWVRVAKGANNSILGVDNSGNLGYFTSISLTPLVVTHDYGAGHADWTMTASETLGNHFTPTNADAAANAIMASCLAGKFYTITNGSGQIITLKVTGQTGGTIANAKSAVYVCNGTDVLEIWEQP